MLVNRYNFIVWGNVPPEPEHLSRLPLGGPAGCASAVVILAPGEHSVIYVNIPTGLNISTGTIALVADNAALTVIEPQVGALVSVNAGLNEPQSYATIAVPAGLKEEYYRLRFGSAQFPYYSNRIWYVPNTSGIDHYSAVFSFRSARDLANIPYELQELQGFRQKLRLKCYAGALQNDSTIEKDNSVTTGRVRTLSIQQNTFRAFTVEHADAIAHEGFMSMLTHKDLLVNDRKYGLKSAYSIDTANSHLATGTFELWDSEFGLVARC